MMKKCTNSFAATETLRRTAERLAAPEDSSKMRPLEMMSPQVRDLRSHCCHKVVKSSEKKADRPPALVSCHSTDARSVLPLAAVMKGGNSEEVIPDQRPLNPLFVILLPSRQEVEGRVTDGGEADFMSEIHIPSQHDESPEEH